MEDWRVAGTESSQSLVAAAEVFRCNWVHLSRGRGGAARLSFVAIIRGDPSHTLPYLLPIREADFLSINHRMIGRDYIHTYLVIRKGHTMVK